MKSNYTIEAKDFDEDINQDLHIPFALLEQAILEELAKRHGSFNAQMIDQQVGKLAAWHAGLALQDKNHFVVNPRDSTEILEADLQSVCTDWCINDAPTERKDKLENPMPIRVRSGVRV